MPDEPAFAIDSRPSRAYDRAGRLSYEGGMTFALEPAADSPGDLKEWVTRVLETGPYRYGDFLELPMVVYLVHDEGTDDVFRVSIRDGRVRLHVLPETEPAGLQQFYERLTDESEAKWRIERRVEDSAGST